MQTRVPPPPPSLFCTGARVSHRPLRYIRHFPSPITTTFQLLTYLWCSRLHLRNHYLPQAKGDFAREVKKSEFTYNTNSPFGKSYGYLIYLQTRNFGDAYWGKFISRTWRISRSYAKTTKDETRIYMLEAEGLGEEQRARKTVNVLEKMKRNLQIQTRDKNDFAITGNEEEFMDLTFPEYHHFDAQPRPKTGLNIGFAEKSKSEISLKIERGCDYLFESSVDTDEDTIPSWAAYLLDTDSTSAVHTYHITHLLDLYEYIVSIHFSLVRENYNSRVAQFITRKPDIPSLKTLKALRFRPFDFYFRAAFTKHIGSARYVLERTMGHNEQKATVNDSHKREEAGRRIKWIQLDVEQKKRLPNSNRLRGYEGGTIWRLTSPGLQSKVSMYLKEKSREEVQSVVSSWESHEALRQNVGPNERHDWITDALQKGKFGKEALEENLPNGPIDLAPGQQKILDALFQKPVGNGTRRKITLSKEAGIAEKNGSGRELPGARNERILAGKQEKQWDVPTDLDWILGTGSTVFSSTSLLYATKKPAGHIRKSVTGAEEQSFQSLLASKTGKTSTQLPSSIPQNQHQHHQQQSHTTATNSTHKATNSHPIPILSPRSYAFKHKQKQHSEDNWAIVTGLFKSPDDYLWGQIDTRTYPTKNNNSQMGGPNHRGNWKTNGELPHENYEEKGNGEITNLSSQLAILERQLDLVRKEIKKMIMNPWWLRYSQPQVGPNSAMPQGKRKPVIVGFTSLEGLKGKWRWSKVKIKKLKERKRKQQQKQKQGHHEPLPEQRQN